MKRFRVETVRLSGAGANGASIPSALTEEANKWIDDHPDYDVISVQPLVAYGDVFMVVSYYEHGK